LTQDQEDTPMKPRPGQVLASTVYSTAVLVVRAPDDEIDLTGAGVEMWDPKGGSTGPAGEVDSAQLTGTQMGKRYADEASVWSCCSRSRARRLSRSMVSRWPSSAGRRCQHRTDGLPR
jgi:hypothetical protein